MTSTIAPVQGDIAPGTAAIEKAYPFTLAHVAASVDKLRGLTFETPERYKEGVIAIRWCREARGQIEERRKQLKADSLTYGRRVDAVAKQLVDIIESAEQPLKQLKQSVDDEKERIKAAAEAERKRLEREAIEAELRVKAEAERSEREAREAAQRVDWERVERESAERRRIEQLALEAERERIAAEKARLQQERAAHEAELAELRAAQKKLAEERAAADAETRAKELAERKLAEERQRELDRMEFEAQQKARRDALRPDVERLREYAQRIDALIASSPMISDDKARQCGALACHKLIEARQLLMEFQP